MCARYNLRATPAEIARFMRLLGIPDWSPREDIRPKQQVPIVRGEQFSLASWSLIPPYAKTPNTGLSTFNAKAETVATSPMYRGPFRSKRCLIPVDSFIEWKHIGKDKIRHEFHRPEGGLFALAGLWESHKEFGESCTIITTEANDVVRPIHVKNRMPVILEPADWPIWFGESSSVGQLQLLLKPAPNELLVAISQSKQKELDFGD